jgi:hypothetical protein
MSSHRKRITACAALGWLCLSAACGGDGSSSGGAIGDDDSGTSPEAGGTHVAYDAGAYDAGAYDAGGYDADASDAGSPPEAATSDAGGLDPSVAPGGNFDLSLWELQEPVGATGAPTTILPAQLVGPKGHEDSYFFTDPTDGSMSFWDPENGVATANSDYPRSELREMTATGAAANWAPSGTNTLSATLTSTLIPDHVAVGQIHLGTGTPASTKPLLELFYFSTGSIVLAIEQTPAGGNEVQHTVGNVPLGTKWSYVIGLSGSTIRVTIDGGAAQTFAMSPTFDQEGMYFKAGDYDQSSGTSATIGAKVQFFALTILHGP